MADIFSSEVVISNTPLPIEGGNATAVKVDGSAVIQPVSGSVSVSSLPEVEIKNDSGNPVVVSGSVTTTPVTSNSAAITQVALSSSTNTMALAANAARKRVIIFAPKNNLYIKFGATASATSFTFAATAANTTVEVNMWVGQIDVFSTVNQTITVTELI